MAVPARALTEGSLGAWLIKARGAEPSTRLHVESSFREVTTRCVRPSYRTGLVRPGQRVLLWISGSEPGLPAGVHAHGRTTGAAADGVIPVELAPLPVPLLRSELSRHPELSSMEVLRMPAGSNPSYVTREQLAVLAGLRAELGRSGFTS